jgi:hypothetical protein
VDERTLIARLREAVEDPSGLVETIRRVQEAIFDRDAPFSSAAVDEILGELAYDLDYFQPDPRVRPEDPSFFGEDRALAEISSALERIARVGQ